MVRNNSNLSTYAWTHPQLTLINASVLALSDNQLTDLVKDCSAVISCLGHNLTLHGMFAAPRALVTDATAKLCRAIIRNQRETKVKFILMNSSGVRNQQLNEQVSNAEKAVLFTLRHLLPPHRDNEQAAAYLNSQIGANHPLVEWVCVRPDSLINQPLRSHYSLHPSPLRSAIFDAGSSSRINVACFMRDLICEDRLWHEWRGKMPILYDNQQ